MPQAELSAGIMRKVLLALQALEAIASEGRPAWEQLFADLRESPCQSEIMAFMREELARYDAEEAAIHAIGPGEPT